jgi:hypothetical protein
MYIRTGKNVIMLWLMPIQQSVNGISTNCKQIVNKPLMILEYPHGIIASLFQKICQIAGPSSV